MYGRVPASCGCTSLLMSICEDSTSTSSANENFPPDSMGIEFSPSSMGIKVAANWHWNRILDTICFLYIRAITLHFGAGENCVWSTWLFYTICRSRLVRLWYRHKLKCSLQGERHVREALCDEDGYRFVMVLKAHWMWDQFGGVDLQQSSEVGWWTVDKCPINSTIWSSRSKNAIWQMARLLFSIPRDYGWSKKVFGIILRSDRLVCLNAGMQQLPNKLLLLEVVVVRMWFDIWSCWNTPFPNTMDNKKYRLWTFLSSSTLSWHRDNAQFWNFPKRWEATIVILTSPRRWLACRSRQCESPPWQSLPLQLQKEGTRQGWYRHPKKGQGYRFW